MKLSRNDLCWCNSGKKYKKCHLEFDERLDQLKKKGHLVPTQKMIKNEQQIEGIKAAAKINNGVLDYIETHIKVGMTTEQIDDMTNQYLEEHHAKSADLNYQGYPKSICTSLNDEVCHGIPSSDVILKEGDIINVDATTNYQGYFADASRMYCMGKVSDEAKKLVEVTRDCLYKGIESIKPWESCIGDIGEAIENYAQQHGYSVVQEFCGHGVGLSMHEDPYVFHFKPNEPTITLVPGMVITIEPMINMGTASIHLKEDNDWTAYTDDGKLSAQWEYTILITEKGIEILSM